MLPPPFPVTKKQPIYSPTFSERVYIWKKNQLVLQRGGDDDDAEHFGCEGAVGGAVGVGGGRFVVFQYKCITKLFSVELVFCFVFGY